MRSFPKDIEPGDEVMVRQGPSGLYTDAGTVARGRHGRQWLPVVRVELGGNWPKVIALLDGSELNVAGAANSKIITRRPDQSLDLRP